MNPIVTVAVALYTGLCPAIDFLVLISNYNPSSREESFFKGSKNSRRYAIVY